MNDTPRITSLAQLAQLSSVPTVQPQPADVPYIGAEQVFLFKGFDNEEEFVKLFGVLPPAADRQRPLKGWIDTSHVRLDPAGNVTNLDEEHEYLVVRQVGEGFVHRTITLTVLEQIRPNVPTGRGLAAGEDPTRDLITTLRPVPAPVRPLLPGEVLGKTPGPFGSWAYVNQNALGSVAAPGGFTAADRALLQAVARKLGV